MDKVAIVTGGAKGIGFSICQKLLSSGVSVAMFDIDKDVGEKASQALRDRSLPCTYFYCNVADPFSVKENIEAVTLKLGKPLILVNNAGIIRDNYIEKISEADWDAVLDVNLKGVFLMCRAVVPFMKESSWGRIINVASRAWLGSVGQINYSSSKGGMVSLTRSLALELARFNITANVVAPALIDTPLTQALDSSVREKLISSQPTKRMGKPEEVAAAVSFFVSEDSGFVTGQVLHVCGGKSVGLAY